MEIYLSFQLPFVSNSISIITRFQLHFLPLVQHTSLPERIVVLVGNLCWQVLNKGAFAENASNSGAVINNCYHTRRLLGHFVPLSCTHTPIIMLPPLRIIIMTWLSPSHTHTNTAGQSLFLPNLINQLCHSALSGHSAVRRKAEQAGRSA